MYLAMATVLAAWTFLIIAFSGFGYAIFTVCRFRSFPDRFFPAFWTGFSFVLFILQIWHFIQPVDVTILLIILILGGCCFAVNVREIFADLRKYADRYHAILLSALALFVANRAMAPIKLYDAGLYHLPVIQWDRAFAIIPGLGNLMDRFGMNNAYLLYQAMLEPIPWTRSFHIANGLLLVILVFQIVVSFLRLVGREASIVDWFVLIFLPATFGQVLDHSGDTSADLIVYLFGVLMASALCSVIASRKEEGRTNFDVFYLSLLAATAVSIKLSALGFAFGSVILVLVVHRSGFRWLFPGVMVMIVWIAGSVVLTGYPIYPITVFPFPFDWKMPVGMLNNIQYQMQLSARFPVQEPVQVAKIRPWIMVWLELLVQERKRIFEILVPFCLFVFGFPLNKKRAFSTWMIFPPILGLLLWFRAPDPRFTGASFWWLVAAVWAPILSEARIQFKIVCAFLLAACLVVSRVYYAPLVVRTGPVQRYPTELAHFVTGSGLLLFVPKGSDSCWESPFPCTGFPIRQLKLRRANDFSGGFKIER
jgi:hypothetical protein